MLTHILSYFGLFIRNIDLSRLYLSCLIRFVPAFYPKPCLVNFLMLNFFIIIHFSLAKIFHVNPNIINKNSKTNLKFIIWVKKFLLQLLNNFFFFSYHLMQIRQVPTFFSNLKIKHKKKNSNSPYKTLICSNKLLVCKGYLANLSLCSYYYYSICFSFLSISFLRIRFYFLKYFIFFS